MIYDLNIERLKNTIEEKRRELNELLLNKNIDKNRALELSEQLDKLIYEYYCMNKEENR